MESPAEQMKLKTPKWLSGRTYIQLTDYGILWFHDVPCYFVRVRFPWAWPQVEEMLEDLDDLDVPMEAEGPSDIIEAPEAPEAPEGRELQPQEEGFGIGGSWLERWWVTRWGLFNCIVLMILVNIFVSNLGKAKILSQRACEGDADRSTSKAAS